jgi:hypothetical protein
MPTTEEIIATYSFRNLVAALLARYGPVRLVGRWLVAVADLAWEVAVAFIGASIALTLVPPTGSHGLLGHPAWLLVLSLATLTAAWWIRSRLTVLVAEADARTTYEFNTEAGTLRLVRTDSAVLADVEAKLGQALTMLDALSHHPSSGATRP